MNENLSQDQFETYYHLTDKRNFKPSARKVPADNAIAITERSRPGLYVADRVEGWWNGHGYHRPYVAEVQVPKGVAQDERWNGEKFIPAEHLKDARVSRVIPVDAHVREKFGEPGWVEEHHGDTFDTHEPLPRGQWGLTPPGHFRGYQYDGPDVREFTPEQHKEHQARLRAYRKAQG